MTFYIPEFWLGVIATLVAEIAVVIVAGVSYSINRRKSNGNESNDNDDTSNE